MCAKKSVSVDAIKLKLLTCFHISHLKMLLKLSFLRDRRHAYVH